MLSELRTFLRRPGARAAASNFGWLVSEKVARLVLNVGVGFWVARYLGPERFGELAYAIAAVGLFSLGAELGLDAVVRRELIRRPEDTARLLAAAAGLRLLGGVAMYAIVVGGGALAGAAAPAPALRVVIGLTLFQPALWVADLAFQARLASRFSVAAQLAALSAGAALRVALIVTHAPLVGFAWALAAETLVAGAALAGLARREGLRWSLADFRWVDARRLLAEAWPLLGSGLAVIIYMRIDALMLRPLAGEREVGIYAAATRFTEVWYFLPVAMASSLLPALLRARERSAEDYARRLQRSYDLYAGVAFALAAPVALAAPWLVRLAYGAAYAAAGPVCAVHVWSSVFVFLGVARSQFLVNEGHTRFYLAATLAGLAVNVVLNRVLIPAHGAWGAAIATLAGQAVAAWVSSFCFAPVRATAWMQTRALLILLRWPMYVRKS